MKNISKLTSGHRFIHLALLIIFSLTVYTANAASTNSPEALLAPSVMNGSFETGSTGNGLSSLSGWTVNSGTVDLLAGSAAANGSASDGSKFLDIANGTIEQTINGFTPSQTYVIRIDYQGNTSDDSIKNAKVIVNGQELTQGLFGGDPPGIHNKEENDWVICNGFEFTPTSTSVTIRIDSDESGSDGLFIDNVQILDGGITQPPEHNFNSLSIDSDGWRPLVNGSFEANITTHTSDPENTGPDDDNPHLCGDSLAGWRVTRENTDRISGTNNGSTVEEEEWNPPDGTKIMDVGGHGPGGIAQTITELNPNSDYKLEFLAARHRFWGTETMTTELWANGQLAHSFSRTINQTAEDGYIREEVTLTSDANGKITFEIFSTNIDKGGNNVMDAFRMIRVAGTATPTFTAVPTQTPSPTSTSTLTPISTETPSPTPSNTNTPTMTSTLIPTQTTTPTISPTSLPTQTLAPTATQTSTLTPAPSATPQNSSTPDGTEHVEYQLYLPVIAN